MYIPSFFIVFLSVYISFAILDIFSNLWLTPDFPIGFESILPSDDNGKGTGDGNGKGDDDGKGQPIIIDNEAPTWETQFKEIVSEIDTNMKKLSEVFEKLKTLSTDIEKVTTKEGAGEIQDKANPILKEYETLKQTIVDLQAQGKNLLNQNVTNNNAKKHFRKASA